MCVPNLVVRPSRKEERKGGIGLGRLFPGWEGLGTRLVCTHLFCSIQVITNVDVQSIEPVDRNMRDSLMKSVQMAIEISTK